MYQTQPAAAHVKPESFRSLGHMPRWPYFKRPGKNWNKPYYPKTWPVTFWPYYAGYYPYGY